VDQTDDWMAELLYAVARANQRRAEGKSHPSVLRGLLEVFVGATGAEGGCVAIQDEPEPRAIARVDRLTESLGLVVDAAVERGERCADGDCVAWPVEVRGRIRGAVGIRGLPTDADPGRLDRIAEPTVSALANLLPDARAERNRAELERLFEFSVDLQCVASLEGWFQRVNPAFTEILGFWPGELKSRPILDFVHPDDRHLASDALVRLRRDEAVLDLTLRFRDTHGEYMWLSWRAMPYAQEGVFYALARDVTDLRAAEALRARLVATLEETTDFVWIANDEDWLVFLNRSTRRALGLPDDDALPTLRAADLVTPDARAAYAGALETAQRTGVWHGESSLIREGGRPMPVSQVVLAHRDERGEVEAFTVVARDITAQKEVERLKNEFVSIVSHELRTPLTSIRGSLGLIDGGATGELPAKAAKMVQIARNNTDRLVRLINDILDLDKIEAGKMELALEQTRLTDVLGRAVAGLEGAAAARGVELTWSVEGPEPIRADPDRIIQVLTNLVGNALKLSPAGGRVEIVARGVDPVRLSVRDEGPGIPQSDLQKVFGRFAQVDASDSRAKGGTGLGLAISKAIVEEHGGRIWAESALGSGATFHFELPRGAVERLIPGPSVERSRVLLVEDDRDLAQVLAGRLTEHGYGVTAAPTLAAAWAELRGGLMPDAVLLDVLLPDGSGLQLIDRMRAEADLRHIPVLVASGRDRAAFEADGEVVPEHLVWLQKPFSEQAMLQALWNATRPDRVPLVLIADDDDDSRAVVLDVLAASNLRSIEARSGKEAVALAVAHAPDLLVLDVGLPDMDGFAVVEALRRQKTRTMPLLVYTARELNREERAQLTLGHSLHVTKARSGPEAFLRSVQTLLGGLVPGPAPRETTPPPGLPPDG
jgi:PAS domain S-box-containing protein